MNTNVWFSKLDHFKSIYHLVNELKNQRQTTTTFTLWFLPNELKRLLFLPHHRTCSKVRAFEWATVYLQRSSKILLSRKAPHRSSKPYHFLQKFKRKISKCFASCVSLLAASRFSQICRTIYWRHTHYRAGAHRWATWMPALHTPGRPSVCVCESRCLPPNPHPENLQGREGVAESYLGNN